MKILEFDTNDVTLVEEKTQFSHLSLTNQSYDGKQNNDFTESKKYFKYFSSKNIRLAVNDIIHQMVKNCSIDVIIDHLIGECIEDHRWKLQTIFVLNEVIKSSQQLKDFNAEPYIDQISSIYLQDHLWRVPISNQYLQLIETRQGQKNEAAINSVTFESLSLTDKPQNEPFSYKNSLTLPFETINHNIQLICLLLEGFSTHSYILRTNYNIHLIKTLYPILEKVGSTNATINKTALKTLNNISMYCNYDSLSDLILFNSDYLINAVTLQFRHMMIDSAAPAVLAVILRLCDKDIMPIVCDSAADVFRLLDEYQEEIAIQMLEVLKQFALAVNKWFCSEQNETGSTVDSTVDMKQKNFEPTDVRNDDTSAVDFFTQYTKVLQQAHGNIEDIDEEAINVNDDDDNDDDGEVEGKEEENKEQQIPLHFNILIKALERCTYFNSAHHREIQLKSLDVTQHCVIALRQRENDLLPALHKIWPSVITKLHSKDMVIVLKSLDIVSCMVTHSGDFLRKRLTTEFLSKAIQFLEEHNQSFSKNKSRFTQIHKALTKMISFLADTAVSLDVGLKDFCNVVQTCAKYLNCHLHEAVQKSAVEAIRKLHTYKPEATWLLLNSLATQPEMIEPPKLIFPKIKFSEDAMKRNVYSDNISIILIGKGD